MFKISKPDLKGRECDVMGMIRDKIRVLYLLLLFCIHMACIHYSLTAARQLHNPQRSAIEQRQLCDSPTILVPTINLRLFSDVFMIQQRKAPRGVNGRGHWVKMSPRSFHLHHKRTWEPEFERVIVAAEIVGWYSEIHLVRALTQKNK